jgi:hypothetical protein
VLDGGDGTAAFVEWRDFGLAEFRDVGRACTFLTATDGVVRCLPWQDQSRSFVYLDKNCTEPAITVADEGDIPADVDPTMFDMLPPYMMVEPAPAHGCEPLRYPVWRAGARTTGTAYWRNEDDGSCLDTETVYSLRPLEQVDPTPFVAAERELAETAGRLRAIGLHGEDGSYQRVGIWDTQRDEECSFIPDGHGVLRAGPLRAGGVLRGRGTATL